MSATDPYVLYEGSSMGGDASGQKAGSVVYRVPSARTAAEALARFDENPALRQHPDDTSVPFDSRTAFRRGPEYAVSAQFSTFKGGRFTSQQPVEIPGWYSWDRGRRRVDSELVVNTREWRVPGNDDAAKFEVWTVKRVKTPEVRPQRILRVRISTVAQSLFDVIDEAIGDIHLLPDGKYWQLVNSDTRPVDATTWDVTYTWEYDKGTQRPIPSSGSRDGADIWRLAYFYADQVPFPGFDPEAYWRPPYCVVASLIVPANPRDVPFGVMFALTGELNPDGWRALPGTEVL